MMNIFKIIISIVLIITFCHSTHAEERKKGLSMTDLTDPESPSYVPYPYPKTREHIIADLKSQLSRIYSHKKRWEFSISDDINLLPELVKENSSVKIGEIVKVKNRMSMCADDYSYLIFLSDAKGKYISRVTILASGLLGGGIHPSKRNPGKKLKSFDKALEKLAKHMGKSYKKEKVKKIERVAVHFIFASLYHPVIEITLEDDSVYCLDYKDRLYKRVAEIPIYGDKYKARREQNKKKKKGDWVFIDSLNDKIVHLEKLN